VRLTDHRVSWTPPTDRSGWMRSTCIVRSRCRQKYEFVDWVSKYGRCRQRSHMRQCDACINRMTHVKQADARPHGRRVMFTQYCLRLLAYSGFFPHFVPDRSLCSEYKMLGYRWQSPRYFERRALSLRTTRLLFVTVTRYTEIRNAYLSLARHARLSCVPICVFNSSRPFATKFAGQQCNVSRNTSALCTFWHIFSTAATS